MIIVHNPLYPITIDVLATILSPYNVQRIVIFQKNRTCILAEFPDVEQAKIVKEKLDGSEIYDGSCLLRVMYSKNNNTLTVDYNDDRTYDFTRTLPNTAPAHRGRRIVPNSRNNKENSTSEQASDNTNKQDDTSNNNTDNNNGSSSSNINNNNNQKGGYNRRYNNKNYRYNRFRNNNKYPQNYMNQNYNNYPPLNPAYISAIQNIPPPPLYQFYSGNNLASPALIGSGAMGSSFPSSSYAYDPSAYSFYPPPPPLALQPPPVPPNINIAANRANSTDATAPSAATPLPPVPAPTYPA